METLSEYPWLAPLGAFVGVVIATVLGYRHRARRDEGNGSGFRLRGAALIDSAIGQEIVVHLKRLAASAEKIEEAVERQGTEAEIERRVKDRMAHKGGGKN